MRPLVPAFRQGLGGEHLSASRADHTGQLGQEPRGEPVSGHDHDVGVELVDPHRVALAQVGPGCGSMCSQAPYPARRLQRSVGRMVDRTEIEGVERRSERVDPFDGEPVLAQRVVLSPERLTLRVIDSEPQAADAPERITRELLEHDRAPAR